MLRWTGGEMWNSIENSDKWTARQIVKQTDNLLNSVDDEDDQDNDSRLAEGTLET